MKVAILSESPTLPTGFARTTRYIGETLVSEGHQVVCFAIGVWGNLFERQNYPYEVWQVGDATDDINYRLLHFLDVTKPDVLIINYDLFTTAAWIRVLKESGRGIKIVAHVVIDGLPVYQSHLNILSICSAVLTPTKCVANSIKSLLPSVPIKVLPHFIDKKIFFPNELIKGIRKKLFPGKIFIGVFAQNRPRKQITQAIQAVKILRDSKYDCNLIIHTDYSNAVWRRGDDLVSIIKYYSLETYTFLKETHNCFDITKEPVTTIAENFELNALLSTLNVAEKINFCSLTIVCSTHAGFEYNIIESQSCAVPICYTEDNSIMSEVSGGAGIKLVPSLYDFKQYGAKSFRISPTTIATAIKSIIDSTDQNEDLIQKGLGNASKYYLQNNMEYGKNVLDSVL